ncbi:hypothetical protein F4808DRAFT_452373 [Astrocystis sublimbata]|nr:hypothetical protein F4808DRAFT_452373 [Astrocystis sublimbata]
METKTTTNDISHSMHDPTPSPESSSADRSATDMPGPEDVVRNSQSLDIGTSHTTLVNELDSTHTVSEPPESVVGSYETPTEYPTSNQPLGLNNPPCSIRDRLALRESVGYTGLTILLGGSVLVLASVAFLSFLWFGYGNELEAAGATWLWRQIVLNNWVTRAITITALALRSIVSFQVALCTSMTAALVLEKRSARKSHVAYLSIARSISDGPRKVIQLLLSSRSWAVMSYVELWLLCFLAAVMLVLQFSSTLLLSDLHDFTVVGNLETKSIANFGSYEIFARNSNLAHTGISVINKDIYPIYGEESSASDATPNALGFSDTGNRRKGYLPFQGGENRTSLRTYREYTLVTNSRTVCVPPIIQGNLSSYTGSNYQGRLVGNVHYGQSIRQAHKGLGPLCSQDGCESVPLDCSIPSTTSGTTAQSTICFIELVGRRSQAVRDFSPAELYSKINMEGEPWSLDSTMFLVSQSNLSPWEWMVVDPHPTSFSANRTTGEWSSFDLINGKQVKLSLCFTRFYLQPQYVSMVAFRPTNEPEVSWDGVSFQPNITALSTYFGVGNVKSPRDRGLMDMIILNKPNITTSASMMPDELEQAELTAALLQQSIIGRLTYYLIPGPIGGCVFCNDFISIVPPEQNLVFTDIIQSTGRAALALQSVFAMDAAAYYGTLSRGFNVTGPVEMTTTMLVRTPGPCSQHQCTGFILVATLSAAHLVTIAIITALYIGQVRYSHLSNTWHTISQLIGEELEDALSQGSNAKDESIWPATSRPERDYFVRLGMTGGSTRGEVQSQTAVHFTEMNAEAVIRELGHKGLTAYKRIWQYRDTQEPPL